MRFELRRRTKNRMRSGQPPDRIFRGFLLCLSHRGGGAMTASANSARKECRFRRSQLPIRHLAITHPQPLRWPAARPAPRSKEGEKAATPGQPVALARVSGSIPPAIRFRKSPAATGSAAIIRQAQEFSRFAEPTFVQIAAPRNTKERPHCAEPVDDETSLWMVEEN